MTLGFHQKLVDESVVLKNTVIEKGVELQLADFTNQDPPVKAELNRLNARSIPLIAIYAPGAKPVVLRDMVTEEELLAALQAAIKNLERP